MGRCAAAITAPQERSTSVRWFQRTASGSSVISISSTPKKIAFPYADEYFSTVLCCELIEHLFHDPMHLMSEVNRILKPGGHLVLTTPNMAALRGISAILQGYHPGFFHAYIRPAADGETDARHNREYTPREIHRLLENSGFSIVRLETGPVSRRADARVRLGAPSARALQSRYCAARRRHLRRGPEDGTRCASAILPGSIRDAVA